MSIRFAKREREERRTTSTASIERTPDLLAGANGPRPSRMNMPNKAIGRDNCPRRSSRPWTAKGCSACGSRESIRGGAELDPISSLRVIEAFPMATLPPAGC